MSGTDIAGAALRRRRSEARRYELLVAAYAHAVRCPCYAMPGTHRARCDALVCYAMPGCAPLALSREHSSRLGAAGAQNRPRQERAAFVAGRRQFRQNALGNIAFVKKRRCTLGSVSCQCNPLRLFPSFASSPHLSAGRVTLTCCAIELGSSERKGRGH
eukprot:2372498-Rhodomonas_salina.1